MIRWLRSILAFLADLITATADDDAPAPVQSASTVTASWEDSQK